MRQIVERGDNIPAVHLTLVDLLRAVIKAARIAKTDCIGGGEKAEKRVGPNDFILVQQRQLTGDFQDALDNKHHIGATRIIFVKHQSDGVLQSPGQNTFLKLGNLLAVFQHNRVFADQINTADMAVEIDAHARPVQPRRDLFNMGRFTRAVITLHHDAAIMGETGEQCQSGLLVE